VRAADITAEQRLTPVRKANKFTERNKLYGYSNDKSTGHQRWNPVIERRDYRNWPIITPMTAA